MSGGVAVERELAVFTTSSTLRPSLPDPALLDSFTLDELREAIRDRRRRLVDELRAERVEVQKALRAVEAELEAVTGVKATVVAGLSAARSGSGSAASNLAQLAGRRRPRSVSARLNRQVTGPPNQFAERCS